MRDAIPQYFCNYFKHTYLQGLSEKLLIVYISLSFLLDFFSIDVPHRSLNYSLQMYLIIY